MDEASSTGPGTPFGHAPAWGSPTAPWGTPPAGGGSWAPPQPLGTGVAGIRHEGGTLVGGRYDPAHPVERAAGLVLDMIVVGLAQTAVWALWTLASVMVLPLIIQGGISRCRSTGVTTLEDCAPGSSWAALIWLMFLVVGVLWAWWRLVPRRMATHGASVGMGVAGLGLTDLRDEGSPVSRLQALWRALLAGALTTLWLPAFGVFLLWSLAPLREDNPVELPSWVPVAAVAVILVLQVLPTAWALVDKRGQTLYDKWSSTLSVARPGPLEPWSMAALCCALAATMFLAVAPVAVVLGHVGAARARRRPGYRRAGTARAALAIGYPCLAVLVVIVGLLILLPPPA